MFYNESDFYPTFEGMGRGLRQSRRRPDGATLAAPLPKSEDAPNPLDSKVVRLKAQRLGSRIKDFTQLNIVREFETPIPDEKK